MQNQLMTYSLSEIAERKNNEIANTISIDEFSTEFMETSLKELLQKNSQLSKQLEKALSKISRLRKQRTALLDEIVKVNKSDDDTDVDSDLSAGDIDSEIDSADEIDIVQKETMENETVAEPVSKRRKITKSKHRRGAKTIEINRDNNGSYILPAKFGGTTLISLGTIVPDTNFYNQNYIFPVGFTTQRPYKSMVKESAYTTYTCSIDKDQHNRPLFCIKAEDAPEIVIEKATPTAAWSEVLRRSNVLRKKEFKNTVSGPEYYGLSLTAIKKMIQELPGAEMCTGYIKVGI